MPVKVTKKIKEVADLIVSALRDLEPDELTFYTGYHPMGYDLSGYRKSRKALLEALNEVSSVSKATMDRATRYLISYGVIHKIADGNELMYALSSNHAATVVAGEFPISTEPDLPAEPAPPAEPTHVRLDNHEAVTAALAGDWSKVVEKLETLEGGA